MRKVMVIIVLLAVLILVSVIPEKHMAIETDASGTKYIKWTAPAGVIGLTSKTIMQWVYPDDLGGGYGLVLIADGGGSDEGLGMSVQITTGKILYIPGFSTTNGVWITTSAGLTGGAWNHVAVTYNGSATTNDPIIYINGASVAITESTTPVGTFKSGTASNLYMGTSAPGGNLDGKVASFLIYNRILPASEIADAYASRLAVPSWNGLVFAPNLSGSAGLQTFDGVSLAAGNVIVDQVTGAAGVPSGNPLAVSDTWLTYK